MASHDNPHALIATQVFVPEFHPTAIMVHQLGSELIRRGWRVTIVTGSPSHPFGRIYTGHRQSWWAAETIDGMTVLRTWHLTDPSRRMAWRAGAFATRAAGAALAGLSRRRVDIVVAFGPPLVGPISAALTARRHRAPLVNVIHDLYPDVAAQTGSVTNRAILSLAAHLERRQYRFADTTVVLGDRIRDTVIARGADETRVAVIPPWLDGDEVTPRPRQTEWRRAQRIPEETLVLLHAGTLGVVSDARVIARAADRLRRHPDILILLVGGGAAVEPLRREIRDRGLPNLRLLPFQPRALVPEILASADAGLVTLRAGLGRCCVPSKVLGYMAAARPTLAVVDRDSDTADQIRLPDAGLVCPPGDDAALATAVLRLRADPELRRKLGTAARAAFDRAYAKAVVLPRFCALLGDRVARIVTGPHADRTS